MRPCALRGRVQHEVPIIALFLNPALDGTIDDGGGLQYNAV